MKLRFYDNVIWRKLREDLPENLRNHQYYQEDNSYFQKTYPYKESDAEIPGFDGNCDFLNIGNDGSPCDETTDCENSIEFFKRFKALPPRLAAQEALWCCLCHSVPEFYKYTIRRWFTEAATEKGVLLHFWGTTQKCLRTRNALARLWWGAYVSYDGKADDPFALTRVLWRTNQDFTDFMDTFNSHSRSRAQGVLLALKARDESREKYYTNGDDFRELNKVLNWRAVVDPLDFWPKEKLRNFALDFFEERKKRNGNA